MSRITERVLTLTVRIEETTDETISGVLGAYDRLRITAADLLMDGHVDVDLSITQDTFDRLDTAGVVVHAPERVLSSYPKTTGS